MDMVELGLIWIGYLLFLYYVDKNLGA